MKDEPAIKLAKHIYKLWDEALSKNDMETLASLYADNAVIESPLIPHLLDQESGICEGKSALQKLLTIVAKRKPEQRKFYRENFFTNGKTLMWEYPRKSPDGEQMDFVEVMELEGGLIKYHRVYWGWRGVNVLRDDEYHNKST